jgi:hypothetical protein
MRVATCLLAASVFWVSACLQPDDETVGSSSEELILVENPPLTGSSSLDFPDWITGTSGDTMELVILDPGPLDVLYFRALAQGPSGSGRPTFQVDASEMYHYDAFVSFDLWCNFGSFWQRFATETDVLMHYAFITGDGGLDHSNTSVTCLPGDEFFASFSWHLEHSKCMTGVPRDPSFDSCVSTVCQGDGFCCNTEWDGVCIDEARAWCGLGCP